MVSPDSVDESADQLYFEYERKVEKDIQYVKYIQRLFKQNFKSFISEMSTNDVLILIKQIYLIKIKSDRIEKQTNLIQQKLKEMTRTNQLDYHSLQNDMEHLRKDLTKLELRLEQIKNDYQKRILQNQVNINEIEVPPNNQSESNHLSLITNCPFVSLVDTLRNCSRQKANDTPTLSHLLVKQMSPTMLNINRNNLRPIEAENKTHLEEETMIVIDSNQTPKISQKIDLSNNIIRLIRGPVRVILESGMNAIDDCTKSIHINDEGVQAVKQGLDKQKHMKNNSMKTTFAEITSDWKYEEKNSDQGYSSSSFWMRDDQGKRILIKTHDHPLSAANEWLAYVLGKQIGLPVNQVQISIYENQLVTLHTDVTDENEKVITFMDLPKEKRKSLLTEPIMECMDLFDHIIQNVDRNQKNILLTMTKTTDIIDQNTKVKIYFIDHGASFGMAKLNGISVLASKFRVDHLAVIKFDPIHKSKQFEKYLNKLPVQDRPLISETLNRFSAIPDDQFDQWINEVKDLLSTTQYDRIHHVLYLQRDIAKRYAIQWGIHPSCFDGKPKETNQLSSEINETVTYF